MIGFSDKKKVIYSMIPTLFCLVVGGILACNYDCPEKYKDLWLLPTLFGIVIFFVQINKKNIFGDLVFIITAFGFSIKCVVGPLLLRYSSYRCFFECTNRKEMFLAILLLISEVVVCFVYINWYQKKEPVESNAKKEQHTNSSISVNNTILFKFVVTVFIITTIMIIISHPYYLEEYSSIFSQDLRKTDHPESSPLFTLFSCIFPISYLTMAVLAISKINRRINNLFFRFIYNILIFSVPLFFMNNSDGFNIISIICLIIYSYKTNGISKKQLIFTMVVSIFISVYIFGYIADNGSTKFHYSGVEKSSLMCQAYFTGITNISGVFHMRNYDIWKNLFYDFYYTIPFRNTLFNISGDQRTVIDYTSDNNAQSQIIPCIGQLYHYIGWLAPFFECLFIKAAYRNYRLCENEKNSCLYYIRLMNIMYLVLTPIMYNLTIYLSRYLITILPMIILYRYASSHEIK